MTNLTAPQIARVVHEANRALQLEAPADGIPVGPEWDLLDAETKKSITEGVQNVLNGQTDPRASHESWCAFKRKHGWTYGPVKDMAAKTHPCLVDYDELPPENKVKDQLFVSIVLALKDLVPASLRDS